MYERLSIKQRSKLFFLFLTIVVCGTILDCQIKYPDKMILYEGERLPVYQTSYAPSIPVGSAGVLTKQGALTKDTYENSIQSDAPGVYEMTVKLFGLIPVKDMTVEILPKTLVVPGGQTVGIKIFTEGLVCVGTQSIKDKKGNTKNIAKDVEISPGDIILAVDDVPIYDTTQMIDIISQKGENPLSLTVLRGETKTKKFVTPVDTKDGYKLGLWLRDSTAGIGTLTFYKENDLSFGALGHPITDSDTGTIMPVSAGEIVEAEVVGVKKGKKGEPGELEGVFTTPHKAIGTIRENHVKGVFGTLEESISTISSLPIASKSQVQEGPAYILSNIRGKEVEAFTVDLQKTYGLSGENRDMVITVKDEKLLSQTGGIVQGMSGSPVIQNGKLVGAVTHVFVNDPTRGYGIFIEKMLENVS